MRGGAARKTVWLASYPKSGNTWVRAILTNLTTAEQLFQVGSLGGGGQPHHLTAAPPLLGLDPRWLVADELDQVRHTLIGMVNEASTTTLFRKTHEVYRPGRPGAQPFPETATRAAILIVRDPRDVALSWAAFFGTTVEEAVAAICRERNDRASAVGMITSQPWGSWSSHTESWLDPGLPFPVHPIRYEDLSADPVGTLLPVLNAVTEGVDAESLTAAVERSRIERLRELEDRDGFRELSARSDRMFRDGRPGGWRDRLASDLAAKVAAVHGPVMRRLGYLAK